MGEAKRRSKNDISKPMRYNERIYSQLSERQKEAVKQMIQEFTTETIENERKKLGSSVLDVFLMASMLTLIEDFQWGSIERKGIEPKIKKFLRCLTARMGDYTDTYDDGIKIALRNHLRQIGIVYEGVIGSESISDDNRPRNESSKQG